MFNGYNFYLDDLKLPIAPPSLKMKVGSNNKTVTLINDGDINILKSPSLVEISFTARFPMRDYPYAKDVKEFKVYYEKLKDLKENKKSFQFIVSRDSPINKKALGTNLTVALEDFTLNEDWEYGDDFLIDITLKQYKHYATKVVNVDTSNIKKPTGNNRAISSNAPTTNTGGSTGSGTSTNSSKEFGGGGKSFAEYKIRVQHSGEKNKNVGGVAVVTENGTYKWPATASGVTSISVPSNSKVTLATIVMGSPLTTQCDYCSSSLGYLSGNDANGIVVNNVNRDLSFNFHWIIRPVNNPLG